MTLEVKIDRVLQLWQPFDGPVGSSRMVKIIQSFCQLNNGSDVFGDIDRPLEKLNCVQFNL
jgi:hypothetical protein